MGEISDHQMVPDALRGHVHRLAPVGRVERVVTSSDYTDAIKGVAALLRMLEVEQDDTPKRWVDAMLELCRSTPDTDASALLKTFDDTGYDDLVVVSGIEFTSVCEHHLLPFTGTATVGYLPGVEGRIVGLSKLGRLVDLHACRPQVQERMTQDIAEALHGSPLAPRGVGVVVSATHSCMALRGVRKRAVMRTSSMLGSLREDAAQRAEFMALHHVGAA